MMMIMFSFVIIACYAILYEILNRIYGKKLKEENL